MGDTDTPDFNKARSFLITFSTITILLWYFGADLINFKLLGNEINIKENSNNIWLVIAAINAYFLARLLQRTPRGSLKFDLSMHELYEETLIKATRYLWHFKLRKHVLETISSSANDPNLTVKLVKFTPSGRMYHYERPNNESDPLRRIRNLDETDRNDIRFSFYIHYHANTNEIRQTGGSSFDICPPRLITTAVKYWTVAKGTVCSPWLFDHITPLLWGALSIAIALQNWWQINHPSGI